MATARRVTVRTTGIAMLGSRASAAPRSAFDLLFLLRGWQTSEICQRTVGVGTRGCRMDAAAKPPWTDSRRPPRTQPDRPTRGFCFPRPPRHHPRGAAPLAGNSLTLRSACCGSVLTTMRCNTPTDQSPQKTLAGSHFYTALILINGLVVIGLHNGGPFGTARRQSMQREGASGGSSTDPTGTGSAGNCHWGAAAAQVPTGSGRRLRLRGWGRNRPPLSEWGSAITTSSHFPLNAGKSL